MRKAIVFGLLLMGAVPLAACSPLATRDEPLALEARLASLGYRQAEPVRAVAHAEIDGWRYLDRRHMVLGLGPGRAYLLEFASPCRNPNVNDLIGYSARGGALTPRDKLVSTDSAGLGEHCLIGQIYRLERLRKGAQGRA